ncbi:hypothetical protein [Rhodoligotrophos defluvii]|uniref:hypothetical protein n=1 Tax=Rhodoligotrophos defluvii TaxID=2561934 RepID=UPI0010C98893|nr:hypothetical protein [Rhodoligotrophos defluvii]
MVLLLTYIPKGSVQGRPDEDAASKPAPTAQSRDAEAKTDDAQADSTDYMAEISRFASAALAGKVDPEEVARLPKSYRRTDCFPIGVLSQPSPQPVQTKPQVKSPARKGKAPDPQNP